MLKSKLQRVALSSRCASFCTFCLAVAGLLSGCSAYDRVTPISPTFLDGADVNHKIENLPFDQAWVKEGFDRKNYTKLFLKPIRTDLLKDWGRSASMFITSESDYQDEAKEIAEYFRTQLISEINAYKDNTIVITETPGPDVLTAEIALTELEFSHPVARGASLAAPIPGTGAALSSVSDPHAAFAARFTDHSGQLMATVADRSFPPTRIVDLNKLTVTSSAREIVAIWAKTMAEAFNKGRLQPTERAGRFSILPW